MKRLAWLLLLVTAGTTAAKEESTELAPRVAGALGPALSQAADPAYDLAPLVSLCIEEHGDFEPLIVRVESDLEKENDDRVRMRGQWLAGRLRRILGDLGRAEKHFEALAETDESSADAMWAYARVLDARGRTKPALEAYEKTLASAETDALKGEVRLRMAMLRTKRAAPGGPAAPSAPAAAAPETPDDAPKTETLVEFAQRDGVADNLRNRAAVVLALLGRAKDATELFEVEGEATRRFRGEVRVAQWHLEAKQAKDAQAATWRALKAAKLKRDRRYALAVLVESHRADKSLDALLQKFANETDLPAAARAVWIDLLRELGRVDEAMRLFRERAGGQFTVEMRRELLEMCREAGRDKELEAAYRDVMRAEPARLEWPEGLSRHFLEQGRPNAAQAIWDEFSRRTTDPDRLLAAAEVLMDLGMDEWAVGFADRAKKEKKTEYGALLFLAELHRNRGRMKQANAALEDLEKRAPAGHKARLWLAESYERIGRKKRAAKVLQELRKARGPEKSEEDLDMRLAVLLAEVGEEDEALALWTEVWKKVKSIPRRAYVEDRLLTIAARVGKLADIAVDLERRIAAGKADQRDSGLLVRLYTKASDSVSAAEVLEEHVKRSGGQARSILSQKARVYLSCGDYHNYEKTVRQLMRIDPEGSPDYMRQLAMSALERGKPGDARRTLKKLTRMERSADGAAFEAGVLALAGLQDEAIQAYRRVLVAYPQQIEIYLLLANAMKAKGRTERAIGMFQHLAETAKKDDMFTIAIDGLLNMEAGKPVLEWARRIVLERLASRHDKMYLYQLLSDLSEQVNDTPGMLTALENALPIAGPRRSSILRELMDLAKGRQTGPGVVYIVVNGVLQPMNREPKNNEKRFRYGRRLLHLGDVVPPDVYLGLGEAFLAEDQVTAAAKTFTLAQDVPDYYSFQRQVASSFEKAGYPDESLRVYGRVLVGQSGDVGLIVKVGELHESLGRDTVAAGLYRRAMDVMLSRRPFSAVKEEEKKDDDLWYRWRPGNVEDFDRHYERVLTGLLSSLDDKGVDEIWTQHRALIDADLERTGAEKPKEKKDFTLRRYPRLLYRAQFLRRLATAFGRAEAADELDRLLLARFPDDEKLLAELVETRLEWGLVVSARNLIEASGRKDEDKRRARFLAGSPRKGKMPAFVTPAEASRLFLPLLLAGRDAEARDLLGRVSLGQLQKEDLELLPLLTSVAIYERDADSVLQYARRWIKAMIKFPGRFYLEGKVANVLKDAWRVLPEEHRKNLAFSVAEAALAEPKKGGAQVLRLIGQLQTAVGRALVEPEQIQKLIKEGPTTLMYQPAPMVEMVPADKRGDVLREIWPKVNKTQKPRFVVAMLEGMRQPAPAGVASFLRGKIKENKAAYREQMNRYMLQAALLNNKFNPDLAYEIARTLHEFDANDALFSLCYAGALATTQRLAEAEKIAVGAVKRWVQSTKRDYTIDNAVRTLMPLLPEPVQDALLKAVDDYEKEAGGSVKLEEKRMMLIQLRNDPDARLAALQAAIAKYPEDINMSRQLYYQLRSLGRSVDAMAIIEKTLARNPRDKSLRNLVVGGWNSLQHPLRAEEVRLAGEEKKEKKASSDETARKRKPATVPEIKKALDAEDADAARKLFRRMWRNFKVGETENRFIFYGSSMLRSQLSRMWPVTPKKETEEEKKPDEKKKRYRGGFPDYFDRTADEDKKKQEEAKAKNTQRNAYEVLAELGFGEAEIRRQLRTLSTDELDVAGKLFEALVKGGAKRAGDKEAVQQLLADARKPGAGKREYALLLQAVELAPDALGAQAPELLKDVAATMNPYDTDQGRRLARVHAARAEIDRAERLYRWAATQLNAESEWYARVSPQNLVDECAKHLKGEARMRAVGAILDAAKPTIKLGYDYDGGDYQGALVLRTWERVL
ncbi:MAG: tetratricopeptide repeat protein, partial [Planctomycetota bacterium]|nr:tetratricopeptide repeat protein [Planctomycetota bacterium]